MTPSYCGNILHVNLTTGEIKYEHPQDDFYRKYIGGSAMGVYYVLKETPLHTDAFSPENTLTFFVSPTTGLAISGQSRINVNARSPLTDAIGDSQAGGFFPAELKFAGFDGIVIHGASPKPVYLLLENGKAEIKDASHLWGKLTGEAESMLKKEIGDEKIEVAQIGPAGEDLVRFAAIMNMHNRANGRTGMGAVMGSKKLKAIVVRGKNKVEPVDRATLLKMNKEGVAGMETIADMKGIAKNGTADVVAYQNSIGSLPTRSYNEGQFEGFENLSGDKMTESILKRRDTCFGCVVHCKRVVETEYKGEKVDPTYGGPEYETIGTFGSFCGVNNLSAVALAHQICDAWGMDTISGGATISFAMECYAKGLITKEQTDGIELKYGDADAMLAMLKNIAARKGFGKLLGEGSARASKVIGKGSEKLLVTCKGQELPAHMPQSKKSMAVIYAVNPFGADHQSAEMDPMYEEGGAQIYFDRLAKIGLNQVQKPSSMNDEKVRFAYLTEIFYSALDTFTLCQFVWGPSWQMYGPDETVALIKAATGWDFCVEEFMQVGERRLNLMRAFNAREGFERKDDTLPVKFANPLQGTGPSAGVAIDFKELEHYKDTYYQLAGWDIATGNPTPTKLAGLGLDWVKV
jgi:aldehyde:ferredoxin oxidoreductase